MNFYLIKEDTKGKLKIFLASLEDVKKSQKIRSNFMNFLEEIYSNHCYTDHENGHYKCFFYCSENKILRIFHQIMIKKSTWKVNK